MLFIRVGGTGNLLVKAKSGDKSSAAMPQQLQECSTNCNSAEKVSTQFVNRCRRLINANDDACRRHERAGDSNADWCSWSVPGSKIKL